MLQPEPVAGFFLAWRSTYNGILTGHPTKGLKKHDNWNISYETTSQCATSFHVGIIKAEFIEESGP